MTTLPQPKVSVAHEPPTPLPLEPEEERAALQRALSVAEADVVLREECPALRDVAMTEVAGLYRRGDDPPITTRRCILSFEAAGGRQVLQAKDWGVVLDSAREQFGGDGAAS